MALSRTQKKEIVEKLRSVIADAETVTFVNFHGLGVADTTEMRHALREVGVGYVVAKKTLANLALKDAKAKGDIPSLDGELAIAYGPETAPAREIYDFSKRHEDKLVILGGIFEGRFLNKEEMMEIAQIPSLEVLRGMFVNLINSPIQRLAVVLSEVSKVKS